MAEVLMDDDLGVLLPEIQNRIIAFLDVPSLLRFAVTCSSHRELTKSAPIWEDRFRSVWPNEVITECKPPLWYRKELFSRVRVRLDGVYVARCIYFRRIQEGASLTDTRQSMPIVYHRLIRFCSDNTAFMVLSEKGTKRSARSIFNDLIELSPDSILTKYRNQVHSCTWSVKSENSTGMTVLVNYFDGRMSWCAQLLLCWGSKHRQGGSRLSWLRYNFWDPSHVATSRRRDLFRQRDSLAAQLRSATIGGRLEMVSTLLTRLEDASQQLGSVREDMHESVDTVPEDLVQEVKIREEHFPVARFVASKKLSYLF